MRHTREYLAATFPEPTDGSEVAVQDHSGYWHVIWREDRNGDGPKRWFVSHDEDPVELYAHLKDAMAVQVIDRPITFDEWAT